LQQPFLHGAVFFAAASEPRLNWVQQVGGGIGILMLAVLTMAGLHPRNAAATKNVLGGVMNASAVLLFVSSPEVHWLEAAALGMGAIAGGLMGAWALHRINEKLLRLAIVAIGLCLTVGLFVKPI
jgi:uncharacterized protein